MFRKKIKFLEILLYICFLIIGVRLFYLQIIKHDYYEELLKNLNEKEVYGDTMPRGKIYDRNGHVIVDNKLVKTIYFKNENKLNNKELIQLAYLVKDYIELDYNKLTDSFLKDFYLIENENIILDRVSDSDYKKFKSHKLSSTEFYNIKKDLITDSDLNKYTDDDKKAIYLFYLMTNGYSYNDKVIKTDASDSEFAYFSESNYKLKGFNTKYTYERNYIYGDTLKSVIGSVGYITSENKEYYLSRGYSLNDKVGLSYLEYMYDDYLKGEKDVFKLDGNNLIKIKDGKVGNDLYLTIDINIQKMVDNILESEILNVKKNNVVNTKYFDKSYVTISDPNNGDILAMSGKVYSDGKVSDNSLGAIMDSMVAGSAVKGASILVGYNEGKIKIGEYMIDSCMKLKGTKQKCSIITMGYVNDLDAIRRSSNIYQFKTALRVAGVTYSYDAPAFVDSKPFEIYRKYFSLFGLGEKTGIDIEGEPTGIKGKLENAGLLMNLAIGQYDSYTNIELNQYIATLANGNNRYSLHFLKEIKNQDEIIKEYVPTILNNLDTIDKKYIDRVKLALGLVIANGTGRGYIDESKNASGKTGTSETFVDTNNDGIYETPSISTSFVSYLPSNSPKYAISITTPNISYVNNYSTYVHPFNKLVIRKITDNLT
ncbi:MAG: penicillin-binding protein 2 [Bacilli bacterium]|nr:penicillin-binding protein 2 [Bacilli bacterium]